MSSKTTRAASSSLRLRRIRRQQRQRPLQVLGAHGRRVDPQAGHSLALPEQAPDQRGLAVPGRAVPEGPQVLAGLRRGQEGGQRARRGLRGGGLTGLRPGRTEGQEGVLVVSQAQGASVDQGAPVHRPVELLHEAEGPSMLAGPAADLDSSPIELLGLHQQTVVPVQSPELHARVAPLVRPHQHRHAAHRHLEEEPFESIRVVSGDLESLRLGRALGQIVEGVGLRQRGVVPLVRVIEVRHRTLEQTRRDQRLAARHDSFSDFPESGLEEHLQLPDETFDSLHVFRFLTDRFTARFTLTPPGAGPLHVPAALRRPSRARGRHTSVVVSGGTSAGLGGRKHGRCLCSLQKLGPGPRPVKV